jgi:peptidoglycan/LPS O-acetylase OafA/YrhL
VVFHSLFTGYGLAFPDGPGPLGWLLEIARRLWVGVPLFFVISGYCVTASADAARRRARPGPNFFWRRFRRIFPPYWIWFLIVATTAWVTETFQPGFFEKAFVPNPAHLTSWQWLGNLTLTETWRWHLTGGVENALLSPSWTLCYEEQFYALVGLVLVCAPRRFFGFLLGLTLIVIAGLFVFAYLGFSTAGFFLDGKWLMFAAGAHVYYIVNYAPPKSAPWLCIPLGIGLLCAAAMPQNLLSSKVNEPNQSYFCAFLLALALVALHRFDTPASRLKALRPMFFCGEMCYSLYLVHWPVVTVVSFGFNLLGFRNPLVVLFLGTFACVGVAIVAARFFHHLVERRFWNPGYAGAKG